MRSFESMMADDIMTLLGITELSRHKRDKLEGFVRRSMGHGRQMLAQELGFGVIEILVNTGRWLEESRWRTPKQS